jgi:mRNA interferase RelE/StbE
MPYQLRVPDEIVQLIRGMHPLLKKRLRAALVEICENPYCGKGLKEELEGLRSYRIKRFRIIYQIIPEEKIGIIAIGPRKYIYEETFKLLRSQEEKNM